MAAYIRLSVVLSGLLPAEATIGALSGEELVDGLVWVITTAAGMSRPIASTERSARIKSVLRVKDLISQMWLGLSALSRSISCSVVLLITCIFSPLEYLLLSEK